jgi:two-component sensor histidine kinase
MRKEDVPMDIILANPSPEKCAAGTADLAAEANHRIANSLAVLLSVVHMHSSTVKKSAESYSNTEVRHILNSIAARIHALSQLHRTLSRSGPDGVICLKRHLEEASEALLAALAPAERSVKVVHTGEACMVRTKQAQPIVQILCETLINAIKYAHPSGVPLIMLVDSEVSGDGRLILTISDDGVGLPEGLDPLQSDGMGFKVMRGLAAELGGELKFQSSHLGLSLRLSLPSIAMAGTRLA